MSLTRNKERIAIGLGVAFAIAIIGFAFLKLYSSNTASLHTLYEKNLEKKRILSQMRVHLLKSVEMEKNAVMALTDQESMEFASQSRAASAVVDQDLRLLRPMVDSSPMLEEKKLLDEFAACWIEFGKVDQIVLQLAVENTNLKAAALSRERGTETVQRLEMSLETLSHLVTGPPDEARGTGLVSRILVAAFKIVGLHSVHIAEADGGKMDQIEARILALETEATQALAALDGIEGIHGTDGLVQGKVAFAQLIEMTDQVVQLSRQNSNIKSLELSLGRKRKITAQCDEALAALQEATQNKTIKATK